MCNSGTDLLFYTDLGDQQPEARVSTSHMCRNFSQISEWVWKHDSELGKYAEDLRFQEFKQTLSSLANGMFTDK